MPLEIILIMLSWSSYPVGFYLVALVIRKKNESSSQLNYQVVLQSSTLRIVFDSYEIQSQKVFRRNASWII